MLNKKSMLAAELLGVIGISIVILFTMVYVFSSNFFSPIDTSDDVVASHKFCSCISEPQYHDLFCESSDYELLNDDLSSGDKELLNSKINACKDMLNLESSCSQSHGGDLIGFFIRISDTCLEYGGFD
ncbi:MAG: hypothetical protein ACOCRX_01735 [Candidatus Woesearchaeota archaeon]